MPPRLGQVRRGMDPARTEVRISRSVGEPVVLPVPLYWDSPTWHAWHPMIARCLFEAIQSRGVLVSALHSELGESAERVDEKSGTAKPAIAGSGNQPNTGQPNTGQPNPGKPNPGQSNPSPANLNSAHPGQTHPSKLSVGQRLLPYRNERYGLGSIDFDDATVVDIQLSPPRDASGRLAYSPEQIQRWEATTEDEPMSGGRWVRAMNLPPDVPSVDQLRSKVQQLRCLCPRAAIILSITPEWIDESLPHLVSASPDVILIRMSQMTLDGPSLADFTLRTIEKISSIQPIPVWMTPPQSMHRQPISVPDCIKMIALGASAVALNGWLDGLIEEVEAIPPPSSFDTDPHAKTMGPVEQLVQHWLDPQLEHFNGLYSSLVQDPPRESLGTFDPDLARKLGLPCIGQF